MKALGAPIRRPIATASAYVAVLALGLAALDDLPVGLAPDLELPSLTVVLDWANATPFEMESIVTTRVEAEAQTLPRVEEVRSTSAAGVGEVQIAFERGTDIDLAEVQLRERLTEIKDELPETLGPPSIQRSLPRGVEGGNFLVLQITGPYAAEALRKSLEDHVVPRLLAVPGVASAEIYGGTTREIRLDADRRAIERGLVRADALGSVLERVGGSRPLGTVEENGHRIPIVLDRPDAEAEAVGAQLLSASPPLLVRDVARVTGGWAEPNRLSRLDGQPSIQLVLEREPGTNVVRVAGASLEMLAAVTPKLPSGIAIETIYDQSERIREELDLLVRRAAISVACIFAVLVLFHRRVRAPLAVIGSVVFSALVTFVLFRAAGLGMNLVTLSGLALAFGMAVDNAIVILENIALRSRRRASTLRTLAATREVLFPLLAATLTTAVVLVPFLYMSGDLRDFYLPFVLAVCLSLTASMGVALTLTPLLSRWTLTASGPRSTRLELRGVRRTLRAGYCATLDRITHRPWVPALVSVLLFAGSLWVFDEKISRGSIFPPDADTRLFVSVEFPPGGEITQADELIASFERHALAHDFHADGFIEQVEAQVYGRRGYLSVRFHPAVARSMIPEVLRDEMVSRAAAVSGVSISVSGQGPGYHSGGANVSPSYQLLLRGPDYLTLERLTENLGTRLKRNGRVKNVDTNLSGLMVPGAVQLALVPDRARLAERGVTMGELVDAVAPAVAGELSTRRLLTDGGEITARVRYGDGQAMTPDELGRSLLASQGTAPFEIGEVLEVVEEPMQPSIRRFNQQYERMIGFEYRGPRKVGNRFVESIVANTQLPPGYSMEEGLGAFLTLEEERQTMMALWMALAFIYMITAALFESLLLPFVALLSVPLSFVGIAAIFWATGESFDRTAYVGLILLAGIAINNSLLFVHRAGALFRRTGDARTAARRAALERARPILMTTVTSVAGLIPLAWSVDTDAVAGWRSLALAGTGGLLASCVFTLTVIPALFVSLSFRSKGVRLMKSNRPLGTAGAAVLALVALVSLPLAATAMSPDEVFVPETTVKASKTSKGYQIDRSLEIGGPDADEPAQFYEKFGTIEADADAKGNIHVLDMGNLRVQVFDANGNFVRSMGQEGEGPGEFKMPALLSVNAGGQVAVFDMVQQRVSIMDSDGSLLRDQVFAQPVREIVLADDGGLLVAHEGGRPATCVKYGTDGEPMWKYGIYVEPEEQSRQEMHMKISTGVVAPRLAITGGKVVHASEGTYCVRLASSSGELGKSFARTIERKPFELPKPKGGEGGGKMVMITREETSGHEGGVKTDVTVGDHDDNVHTFDMDQMKKFLPEFEPDIRGVVAWPDGRIWVATSQRDDDTMTVDEWTTGGALAQTFELSADYDALRVGRDGVLYAVGHDEDDFPIVWRLVVRDELEG